MRADATHRMPFAGLLAALVVSPIGLVAQEPAAPAAPELGARVLASEVELSRDAAELTLELTDGRTLELALRDGEVIAGGERVGSYERDGELADSWRDLLDEAMLASNAELASLLVAWRPPEGDPAGARLDLALEAALLHGEIAALAAAPEAPENVEVLQSRIRELEEMVEELEERDVRTVVSRAQAEGEWRNPLRHLGRGLAGIMSTIALYAVLVAIGFATVFFGRTYLEGVADTAREFTLRSWAVGLAGSFLAIPVFVLGTIALAISIVGIPLLLAWLPLFPVAVGLAAVLGYLAVGHAAGEALAERRLQGAEWLSRGNSYYYLLTGTGLLLALFLAGHIVDMAGPWLGFIHGLLMFFGVVLTWAALTIGFGAVLLSRGGTRPPRREAMLESEEVPLYGEQRHV